jgi:hypothetical protein
MARISLPRRQRQDSESISVYDQITAIMSHHEDEADGNQSRQASIGAESPPAQAVGLDSVTCPQLSSLLPHYPHIIITLALFARHSTTPKSDAHGQDLSNSVAKNQEVNRFIVNSRHSFLRHLFPVNLLFASTNTAHGFMSPPLNRERFVPLNPPSQHKHRRNGS